MRLFGEFFPTLVVRVISATGRHCAGFGTPCAIAQHIVAFWLYEPLESLWITLCQRLSFHRGTYPQIYTRVIHT